MDNKIFYYYNIFPNNISINDDTYTFSNNDNKYLFQIFKRPATDAQALYDLNKKMIEKDLMVHEIILNKENKVITYINYKPYILMKINNNLYNKISVKDICYINNKTVDMNVNDLILRNDWVHLWEAKNDYIESQVNEIGNKYYNLCNYINYYIGLAENAIVYVKKTLNVKDNAYLSVSHKRINNNATIMSLYNPLDYVYDFRVRDITEYIKNEFFNGKNVYSLVNEYFNNNYVTYKEALLFYGRLLYPSYFFDMYDQIINNKLPEYEIEKIISKSKEYECFLNQSYTYISKLYNVYFPEVSWIIKKRD